jgi:autotransporter-associated beta strand protein
MPSVSSVVHVALAVTLVMTGGASGQTTNTWTGATSGALTATTNYAPGAVVNDDGNSTAVFVFGSGTPVTTSLTATGTFNANRIDFEGSRSFILANTEQFNFVGAAAGITQNSSANQTFTGGVTIVDGPLRLGGDGAGLVTLAGTTNDYAAKGISKTGTSAFLLSAGSALSSGTVTLSGGTLALSSTTTLTGPIQLRGGVIATSGTFSRTLGSIDGRVNFGLGGGGFAAYGGALSVTSLFGTWGSTANGLRDNTALILGSNIADNIVTLTRNLALGASAREIRLVDNTSSANDAAVISGILSGTGGGLNLTGSGNLTLSGANQYTGTTTIGNGVTLSVATIGNGSLAGNLGQASSAAANFLINGGTLRYTGITASTDRNFTLGAGTTSTILVSAAGTNLTMTGGSAATTGAINKTGDGVLTLSGASSHTGGTILSAGTLRATITAEALGAGTLTLAGGILDLVNDTALDFGRNTTVTASTQINSRRTTTGAGVNHSLGSLAIGAQTLTAATDGTVNSGTAGITFGATTLSASGATFTANAGTWLMLGAVTGSNTAFTVNGAGNTSIGGVIGTGTGSLTKDGAGSLILLAANTFSGTTAINGGLLQVGDGGTTGTLGSGNVTLASGATLRFNRSDDLIVANVFSGAGGLMKLGSGVLTLTGTNTFTGGTAINDGLLQVNDSGASTTLGSGSVAIASGTTLRFNRANDLAVANVLSGTGNLRKLGGGVLTLTGTSTFSGVTAIDEGSIRVGDGGTSGSLGSGSVAIATGAFLQFNRSNDLTVSNTFSGTGGLTKLGGGTLAVTGTSTFSGDTRIDAGALQVGDGGTSGALGSGNVAIAAGASLQVNRSNDLTMANIISGAGSFTKTGGGHLTLTGINTFTGGASIDSGAVRISADANLGNGNVTLAGGTLAATETLTLNSIRELWLTATSSVDVAANRTLTFDGSIFGDSDLDKLGDGVLSFGGTSNAYSGMITVVTGELRLTAASRLANASISQMGGILSVQGGAGGAPTEVFLPKISGSGGVISVAENTVAVLSYEGDSVQTYGGRIRGSGGFRKQGNGLVTLSGDNDFSGQAEIADGTLFVQQGGSLGGSAVVSSGAVLMISGLALSTVDVESGAVLGGGGAVEGFVSIKGIHSPGNSPGVQTFNAGASYEAGSTFEWDLLQNFSDPTGRGTAYDGVNVTAGQLFIAAGAQSELRFNLEGSTVNWSNSFWATDQQWLVFDNASAPSGLFGAPSVTVDSAGATLASLRPDATFSWGQVGNDVYLNYTIPEPSSALFAIAGVLGLSLRRRR